MDITDIGVEYRHNRYRYKYRHNIDNAYRYKI